MLKVYYGDLYLAVFLVFFPCSAEQQPEQLLKDFKRYQKLQDELQHELPNYLNEFERYLKIQEVFKHKYTFALQWPQTAMMARTTRRDLRVAPKVPGRVWTVSGLWAEDKQLNVRYDEETIEIPSNLYKVWPSFSSQESTASLFNSEYSQHGRTQVNYLSMIYMLMKRFNAFDRLAKGNVVPSDKKTHHLIDVLEALAGDYYNMGSVVVRCLNPKNEPHSYLQEVRFCLNDRFKLTPCSDKVWQTFNCPDDQGITYLKRKYCKKYKNLYKGWGSREEVKGELEECWVDFKDPGSKMPWFDDENTWIDMTEPDPDAYT